ncbi:MAG: HAMP domain-containing protein [Gammaproteobacteria bacterium]|nr:HAMP domain-containing protein [Gammaproteobacteria bacterium]MCP5417086.1 HAMP domain-containing protein [Chromatiaceae bacterium]
MIRSRFDSIKIHTKILLGFATILAVLLGVAALTLYRLNGVQDHVTEVVGARQPTVFLTKELTNELQRVANSLGFYLLSKEAQYKENYFSGHTRVSELIDRLKALPNVKSDNHAMELLAEIEEDIVQFRTLENELFEAAENYEKNFPGVAYANANINPLNRMMVQLASQMIQSELEEESDETRRRLLAELAELRYVWSNVMNGIRGYLAFRSDSVLQDMSLYLEQAEILVGRIAAFDADLTLDQADALEQFRHGYDNYRAKHQELVRIHGSERWRTDTWLVRDKVGPLIGQMVARLNTLVKHQEQGIRETSQALMADIGTTKELVGILLGVGLVLGLVISWFVAKTISRPLEQAAGTMRNIASGEGDLTKTLNKTSHDEIGILAESFNAFVATIREIIARTAQSTGLVISAVAKATENTDEITRRILSQESDTAQVATAINQMTATIAKVSASAATGESAAKAAAEEVDKGREVVSTTVAAITALAGEVALAEQTIDQVNRDSAEIGSVLDVIKAIADQTNLLALNAAIEAARAGEQGRGFAVVADEVRNLANRTQSSTGEIESMIQRLQEGTARAVEVMQKGRSDAESNVVQSQCALDSLREIGSAIQTINSVNTQIATAAAEQQVVAEEVNRSINSISEASSATAQCAQRTTGITDQLGQLASDLQRLVMQFKISGEQGLDFKAAKAAHLAWKARIRAFLDGRGSLTRQEALSHHDCVLGKWYYGEGIGRYGNLADMAAIEQPHTDLHRIIREIIELKGEGRLQEAEARYRQLDPLSEKIVSLLDALEQRIEAA